MINDYVKYLVKTKTINYWKVLVWIIFQNIKQLKYIDPDINNKYEIKINLDCLNEYLHNITKIDNLTCHSFQIVYRVKILLILLHLILEY